MVRSGLPPSVDAQQSGITGDLPSSGGFGLIVWAGGPVEEIDAAAQIGGCDLTSVFATEDGRFVAYVVGAPDFVNAAFIVAIEFDVPPGTAVAVVCSPPLAGEPDSFTIDFIDVGQGDATLITVNDERLLIDGGRSQDRLEARLSALGITDLDATGLAASAEESQDLTSHTSMACAGRRRRGALT